MIGTKRMNKIGEVIKNKYGRKMRIVEFNSSTDIIVEFDDGYVCNGRYDNFKGKNIVHPMDKSILGIGYIGFGEYKRRIDKKDTFIYTEWHGMLSRCYNKNQQLRNKTKSYKYATVCEEWHNFQNFAKWYNENYYRVDEEKMVLDKDILHKGNKTYSQKIVY